MVSRRVRMTSLMRKYYEAWLNTPTVLGNPRDVDKFYQFAKACVQHGRTRRCGAWLRPFLESDLPKRFADKQHVQRLADEAACIFDHIMDYEQTPFPNPLVELRSRSQVENALRRVLKEDGSRFYSDEDIELFLENHFPEEAEDGP
jgi:hypothetical protein